MAVTCAHSFNQPPTQPWLTLSTQPNNSVSSLFTQNHRPEPLSPPTCTSTSPPHPPTQASPPSSTTSPHLVDHCLGGGACVRFQRHRLVIRRAFSVPHPPPHSHMSRYIHYTHTNTRTYIHIYIHTYVRTYINSPTHSSTRPHLSPLHKHTDIHALTHSLRTYSPRTRPRNRVD